MSLNRPASTFLRGCQVASRSARFASSVSTSTPIRKPTSTPRLTSSSKSYASTTGRKVLVPKTPSSGTKAASTSSIASSPAPSAPTSDNLPSIDDIDTPARTSRSVGASSIRDPTRSPPPPLTSFPDESYVPLPDASGPVPTDQGGEWDTSFSGLSFQPFPPEVAKVLLRETEPAEVEVKPDGILFMPEIRYRRRLNEAFGPGGWGLAPRGASQITDNQVSREWGLVCLGRLVAVSRGESDFFDKSGITTAHESTKSNALMRCCKDLGIASELWDPSWIRKFKDKHVVEVFAVHYKTGMKKKLFRKKTDPKFTGTYKE